MADFEVHITVNTHDIEGFTQFCNNFKVKPLVLSLQNVEGSDFQRDVQVSDVILNADKRSAKDRMFGLSATLEASGFDVVRMKLEGSPHCKEAVEHHWKKRDDDKYFEAHFQVLIKNLTDRKKAVKFAQTLGAHMSRNAFKTFEDGSYVQMLTKRWYKQRVEIVESDFASIVVMMQLKGMQLYKTPHLEFALYDNNISHDLPWFGLVRQDEVPQ